jgi:diacylglycerol kinase (ATP)
LEISVDGAPAERSKIILCAITNGQTYGGGLRVCPFAKPDDGLLSNALVGEMSLPKFASRLPLIAIARQDLIKEFIGRDVRNMEISSPDDKPVIAQIDGEVFTGTHFEVSVEPAALRVMTASEG